VISTSIVHRRKVTRALYPNSGPGVSRHGGGQLVGAVCLPGWLFIDQPISLKRIVGRVFWYLDDDALPVPFRQRHAVVVHFGRYGPPSLAHKFVRARQCHVGQSVEVVDRAQLVGPLEEGGICRHAVEYAQGEEGVPLLTLGERAY
jgi:hypothetical protein